MARHYLDTNDTYMREYAIEDKRFGYYITDDIIRRIQNENEKNGKYYITTHVLKNYDLHEMIGSKIFKYTATTYNDNRYIVVNWTLMILYHTLTGYYGRCGKYDEGFLKLVFNACLSNYGVVDYLTKDKIEFPIAHCRKFNIYRDMLNYNSQSQYERRISRRLKKYLYKDVSNIIIQYILLPTFPLLKKR